MDQKAKAREFAIKAHGDQKYGDLPYVTHLDAVADLVRPCNRWDNTPEAEDLAIIAYLHDVLEDTEASEEAIMDLFGVGILVQIGAITDPSGKNRKERKRLLNERLSRYQGDFFDKALIVKAADRLANMRHSENTNRDLLDMYVREYPEFRASAYRSCCHIIWADLDSLVSRRTSLLT